MLPRVSVVVPTFNGRAWIGDTFAAVRTQTVVDQIEIIVVDDGSSDGTAEVVEAICPPARVIRQPRRGVGSARNRGLAEARGEFVCFLDQDDIWHPQQLERQLALMDLRPEVGAVATPYRFWLPAAEAQPAMPDDPGLQLVPGFEGWTYHQFLRDCWALTSATMLRVELLRELGGFDVDRPYAEDWELWLRVSRRAPFVQLAWPPVLYRQHPSQGSRSLRETDHRVDLLLATVAQHGLASPDGQTLGLEEFDAIIARYRMEFGYHHAMHGRRSVAVRSLLMAWRARPARWRWGALALAVALGWRPRRPGQRLVAGCEDVSSSASLSAQRSAAPARPAAEK